MKLGRGVFQKGWLDVVDWAVDWAVGVEEDFGLWAVGCGLWWTGWPGLSRSESLAEQLGGCCAPVDLWETDEYEF